MKHNNHKLHISTFKLKYTYIYIYIHQDGVQELTSKCKDSVDLGVDQVLWFDFVCESISTVLDLEMRVFTYTFHIWMIFNLFKVILGIYNI